MSIIILRKKFLYYLFKNILLKKIYTLVWNKYIGVFVFIDSFFLFKILIHTEIFLFVLEAMK